MLKGKIENKIILNKKHYEGCCLQLPLLNRLIYCIILHAAYIYSTYVGVYASAHFLTKNNPTIKDHFV